MSFWENCDQFEFIEIFDEKTQIEQTSKKPLVIKRGDKYEFNKILSSELVCKEELTNWFINGVCICQESTYQQLLLAVPNCPEALPAAMEAYKEQVSIWYEKFSGELTWVECAILKSRGAIFPDVDPAYLARMEQSIQNDVMYCHNSLGKLLWMIKTESRSGMAIFHAALPILMGAPLADLGVITQILERKWDTRIAKYKVVPALSKFSDRISTAREVGEDLLRKIGDYPELKLAFTAWLEALVAFAVWINRRVNYIREQA